MNTQINYSSMQTETLETIRDNVNRSLPGGETVYQNVTKELDYRQSLIDLSIESDRLTNSLENWHNN